MLDTLVLLRCHPHASIITPVQEAAGANVEGKTIRHGLPETRSKSCIEHLYHRRSKSSRCLNALFLTLGFHRYLISIELNYK